MDMFLSLAAFLAEFFIFFVYYFVLYVFILIFALVIGGIPIALHNKTTNHTKVLRPRFSFTYYFFGFFTPLVRRHWSSFAIALVLDVFTLTIGRLIYAFFINKTYIKHLKENGYEVIDNFQAQAQFGGQTANASAKQPDVVKVVDDTEE